MLAFLCVRCLALYCCEFVVFLLVMYPMCTDIENSVLRQIKLGTSYSPLSAKFAFNFTSL